MSDEVRNTCLRTSSSSRWCYVHGQDWMSCRGDLHPPSEPPGEGEREPLGTGEPWTVYRHHFTPPPPSEPGERRIGGRTRKEWQSMSRELWHRGATNPTTFYPVIAAAFAPRPESGQDESDGYVTCESCGCVTTSAASSRESALREALEDIQGEAEHGIPFYAYGESEGGSELGSRLDNIAAITRAALAPRPAREGEGVSDWQPIQPARSTLSL